MIVGLTGASFERKSTEATSEPRSSLDSCNGGQLSQHVNAAISASPQLTCYYVLLSSGKTATLVHLGTGKSVSTTRVRDMHVHARTPDAEE